MSAVSKADGTARVSLGPVILWRSYPHHASHIQKHTSAGIFLNILWQLTNINNQLSVYQHSLLPENGASIGDLRAWDALRIQPILKRIQSNFTVLVFKCSLNHPYDHWWTRCKKWHSMYTDATKEKSTKVHTCYAGTPVLKCHNKTKSAKEVNPSTWRHWLSYTGWVPQKYWKSQIFYRFSWQLA